MSEFCCALAIYGYYGEGFTIALNMHAVSESELAGIVQNTN